MNYYLKNNRIWVANEKMPADLNLGWGGLNPDWLKKAMDNWHSSLQPCEISESELCLILSNVSKLDYDSYVEVTDMIRIEEIKTITKSGTITEYQFFFKQPSDNNGVITFNEKEVGLCYDTLFNNFCDFYRENKMDSILTNNKDQKIFEWFLDNFEHPKQVDGEIEAVEFAEWTYKNHWVLNQRSMSWYIELPSGVIDLSTGKTSIELYKIFKNQKQLNPK